MIILRNNNLFTTNVKMEANHLQVIWQKFIDVQEQMLKLRTAPVAVVPESARLIGEKLYLAVDENDRTDKLIQEFAKVFNINIGEIDVENRFFLVDSDIAQSIDIDEKWELSERAANNFVNFRPFPIIDGYINKKESGIKRLKKILSELKLAFDFDSKERLQISISDLVKLIEISHSEANLIRIPDTASLILPISANTKYYISKNYPSLVKNNLDYIDITNSITTKNRYLSDVVYEKLKKEIGLELQWYKFIFKIESKQALKYNPETSSFILPDYNPDDSSFIFFVNVNTNYSQMSKLAEDEKLDFNFKYTRLKRFFDLTFGAQNYVFEAVFNYSFCIQSFDDQFYKDLMNTNFENLSLSENANTIGIDFNWKEVSLKSLVSELHEKYPYIHFNLFKNHKCNLDFQMQDPRLDEVEQQLREKFPSIQTKRDDKMGTLYFFQEYKTDEQGHILRRMIESEIESLNTMVFETGLYSIPERKEKYFFELDYQSKKESQMSSVKELRGYDFSAEGSYFGKLLRISYPEMIFDISGDGFEKAKLLFESQSVFLIEPNLTGDLEKIFRLRNSFINILEGRNLQNPNLRDFIFDSGRAKRIDNIETYLDLQSEVFIELNNHLLNNKVNESQKKAIIKTLLAEDLALIQGPPGTGKSTAIAEIIWQHIRKNPRERILLTSETNLAVDNAIDRIVNTNHNLVKPIRIGGEDKLEMEGLQFSADLMKRWVENGNIALDNEEINEDEESLPQKMILLNWLDNIKSRVDENGNIDSFTINIWKDILSNPTKETRKLFYDNYLKNCNVIGATCSSIGEKNTKGYPTSFFKTYCEVFGNKGGVKFSTVIQDESSKATPAELALPLTYGKKNIIIGDHRQLPPLLDKEEFMLSFNFLLDRAEKEEDIKKIIKLKSFIKKHFNLMEISHFERLFEGIDESLKGIFNLQYRMHSDINEVIKQFYTKDGGLDCGWTTPIDLGIDDPDMKNPASRYHGIEVEGLLYKENHVVWIDTKTPELLDGTSRVNYGEVEAIREVLTKLRTSESFKKYQSFWTNPEDQQIGIISFYGKQIRLLRNLRNEFRDIPIRVSTVDRFQGMERNIIIVSMVRSNCIAADKNQKADYNLFGDLGFPEQNELGFAQSPNRLNVALSRAKRLLIIVGNSDLFRRKDIYNNVYQTIANNPNGRIIESEVL